MTAICRLLGYYVDKQQVDAQVVLYKPSPVPTKQTEMSIAEWQALWRPRDADGNVLGAFIEHLPDANGSDAHINGSGSTIVSTTVEAPIAAG